MSVRRLLASLGLVLAATACSENLSSPPPALEAGPHFLKWANATKPEFAFLGADAIGSRFAYLSTPTPAVVDQSSSATATNATTLSWAHTVGTASNRLLVVGVSIRNGNTAAVVSGVSYGGAPLTYLGSQSNSDNAVRVELWYLNAPASGTASVSVTLTAKNKMVGGAVSFSGVNPVSPLRGFASVGGTTNTTDPWVADSSNSNEVVVAAVATAGAALSLTPSATQTANWSRFEGTGAWDAAGAGGTSIGAAGLAMGWATEKNARWAIAAAVVKPAVGISLTRYQATFWAKRGTSRTLQINYSANGGTSPFMKLTVSDPTYVPGRGNIAVGDSVLMTATVDPNALTISLEPHQTQFGTPSQLQIWYSGAGGDLNDDGVVDANDSYIENNLLGMWYQADPTGPWSQISATQSLSTKSFTSALQHFSGYSVSW